ncbi:MAG: pyrimidine 5'-nucleotidase [Sphingopyxis sp.]
MSLPAPTTATTTGSASSANAPGSAAPLVDRIRCWLFDLDNTLYPPATALFDQIDVKMGQFIMQLARCDAAEARAIQKRYFHDHGTTLAGLMMHHGVEAEDFLRFVHDVDLSHVGPDHGLRAAISRLPGECHIFTNADADYARAVLRARGLDGLFSSIIDIRATGYIPKPQAGAYSRMAAQIGGFSPECAVFIDDMSRNLRPAHAMGITTVWLDNGSESGDRDHDADHVDHHIDDLALWLNGVTNGGAG